MWSLLRVQGAGDRKVDLTYYYDFISVYHLTDLFTAKIKIVINRLLGHHIKNPCAVGIRNEYPMYLGTSFLTPRPRKNICRSCKYLSCLASPLSWKIGRPVILYRGGTQICLPNPFSRYRDK